MRNMGHRDISPKLDVHFLLLCIFLASFGCMDPGQYEPEEPPVKTDPPAGPSVILPEQDTLFRCEYSVAVALDWTAVDGAEGYEYQVNTDSSFAASFPYQVTNPPTAFHASCYPPITTYFFRVRAHSSAWTWYTDWSGLRRFHLMPVEDDTIFHWN
jgi:hypothetical protein